MRDFQRVQYHIIWMRNEGLAHELCPWFVLVRFKLQTLNNFAWTYVITSATSLHDLEWIPIINWVCTCTHAPMHQGLLIFIQIWKGAFIISLTYKSKSICSELKENTAQALITIAITSD